MTLTLILMRHAKSAWDDPAADDFDRTLNERGRIAAPRMAKWLIDQGHIPEKAVVSSSCRTLETWDRMAPFMPKSTTMERSAALYLAGSDIIQGVLKAQSAPGIMIICHNPGIADFAARALASQPKHPDFQRYPTAATTVMSFDIDDWSDMTWASATPVAFAVPKDLGD